MILLCFLNLNLFCVWSAPLGLSSYKTGIIKLIRISALKLAEGSITVVGKSALAIWLWRTITLARPGGRSVGVFWCHLAWTLWCQGPGLMEGVRARQSSVEAAELAMWKLWERETRGKGHGPSWPHTWVGCKRPVMHRQGLMQWMGSQFPVARINSSQGLGSTSDSADVIRAKQSNLREEWL